MKIKTTAIACALLLSATSAYSHTSTFDASVTADVPVSFSIINSNGSKASDVKLNWNAQTSTFDEYELDLELVGNFKREPMSFSINSDSLQRVGGTDTLPIDVSFAKADGAIVETLSTQGKNINLADVLDSQNGKFMIKMGANNGTKTVPGEYKGKITLTATQPI